MRRLVYGLVVLSCLAYGCSSGDGDGPDGTVEEDGADAGHDAGMDAGHDAGKDAGGDAGTDAGFDAGGDAGIDAGGDVGADSGDPGKTVWRPAPGTNWQWQLSGTIDTSFDVVMYDIDLFETPAATIADLHAAGRIVICYFSAGSYENFRPDKDDFPPEILGEVMDGWPDERWLDVRAQALRPIMQRRLDLAVQKGCDGVEPDNVDGYQNNSGFPLTAADQLAYNRFLASEAHARNLSVGLKNDLDQVPQLVADFDWALDEECFAYDECDTLLPFIRAGKAVFQVEYGSASLAATVCPQANALNFDTLIKNLDLDAWRVSCR
ncbi:MAG: endo alpha-1,4 polygalactosaminidase [Myxococcales bacterium]|nr:endo alpha-1,4 polygalactosaminidase [Myxococcales bacterium]